MRRVGIRELKESATQLIDRDESLVVEKNGRPVGVYVPLRAPDAGERRRILARLERTVNRVRRRTGLTETDLAELMAWR